MARQEFAFIDFEATGLGFGSWPVEVGWSLLTGEVKSLLITPSPYWSMDAWDPVAEAMHGLSLKQIKSEGLEAAIVCDHLNADLAGCNVYSDAPAFDAMWLGALFNAAPGKRPAFRLCDIHDLLDSNLTDEEWRTCVEAASDISPRAHRAAADVKHLQALYAVFRDRFPDAVKG